MLLMEVNAHLHHVPNPLIRQVYYCQNIEVTMAPLTAYDFGCSKIDHYLIDNVYTIILAEKEM